MEGGEVMSERKMVLTAVGPDRPGLVEEFSSVIHKAGANLEDSRMAVLAGDFALIVLFAGSPEAVEEVRRQAAVLQGELDFHVHLKEATPPPRDADFRLFELEVAGMDRPGIVHRVSSIIAELDLNVASLESRLEITAFHGTPMFVLRAEIQVPRNLDIEPLAARLDLASEEMNLNYDLSAAEEGGSPRLGTD
jgi:glycine cleavage system transcriptional repressor